MIAHPQDSYPLPERAGVRPLARVAATALKPGDIFITGEPGIFAVDALAGPIRYPIGRAIQKLGGAECVGKQNQQFALVTLLP